MESIIKAIKKKKKETKSVMDQVFSGVKGDWQKLLNALETDPTKKKIAKPGK